MTINNIDKINRFNKGRSLNIELQERTIKQILEPFLISQGWTPNTAFATHPRTDIEAVRGKDKWIIELKRPQTCELTPVDYFIYLLGQIIQRMENPRDKYSIALPDTQPFRRLWKRLPALSKERLSITALFVNRSGLVTEESLE